MKWFRHAAAVIAARLPMQWHGRPYLWLYLLVSIIVLSAAANTIAVRVGTGDSIGLGVEFFRGMGCPEEFSERKRLFLGECITAIDGKPVSDGQELHRLLQRLGPGHKVELRLLQPDGSSRQISDQTRVLPVHYWMAAAGGFG